MLAVTFDEFGSADVLAVRELPCPTPGSGEVVVRVAASPVNPTDILMRTGRQRSMMGDLCPPYIAGMEFSGHIHDAGQASHVAAGQAVMGVVNPRRPGGGAHAQYISVPMESIVPLDPAVDLVQAATIPMNGLTASMAIDAMGLPRGSTLLVTGAAGVLAGHAISLARLAGIFVIADAKESDLPWLCRLGADAIVPRGPAMFDAVRTGWPQGVDAVIDTALLGTPVGGLVCDGGCAVSVRRAHPIEDARLRHSSVSVLEQMRNTAALGRLAGLLQQGKILPRVVRCVSMKDAAMAHRITEQGGLRGRVVMDFLA